MPDVSDIASVAINAAHPVAVKAAGGGSTASWVTAVCAAVTTIVSGLYVFVPKMLGIKNKRLGTLDDERRADMDLMRSDIKELRTMVSEAVNTANAAETRSAILRAVVSMLTAEVMRLDPANPVLKQAQVMIADASAGDLGMGKGLADIAAKAAGLT